MALFWSDGTPLSLQDTTTKPKVSAAWKRAVVRERKKFRGRLWDCYQIKIDRFDRMIIAQSGRCAICIDPLERDDVNVDHCHRTGKVRGILCSSCKTGIGSLRENLLTLANAIRYLRKHNPTAEDFARAFVKFDKTGQQRVVAKFKR